MDCSAVGDYDNYCIDPKARTTSECLSKNPYHYALELLRKAKLEAMADPMIIERLSRFSFVGGYVVSNARHLGFEDVDFGWGKAVYGGVAKENIGFVPELLSVYMPYKNNKGDNGIVVSICLPENAMDVFTKELEMLVENMIIIQCLHEKAKDIFVKLPKEFSLFISKTCAC
ncbi:hypothetical protein ABFS82_11G106400 [Erythranthe guttata]|uniref:Uncharacterized protein n=1 Tax=Erythranthe guttata TaxID=4155 RepID=A0A022RMV6_ERYGU|nr:hypothetical protein MIMGU_mgv11b015258mg [Erythranthe guttata]